MIARSPRAYGPENLYSVMQRDFSTVSALSDPPRCPTSRDSGMLSKADVDYANRSPSLSERKLRTDATRSSHARSLDPFAQTGRSINRAFRRRQWLKDISLLCGNYYRVLRRARPGRVWIRKSSSFFPALSCADSQRGCFPRPAQVSDGLAGLLYFGNTCG